MYYQHLLCCKGSQLLAILRDKSKAGLGFKVLELSSVLGCTTVSFRYVKTNAPDFSFLIPLSPI